MQPQPSPDPKPFRQRLEGALTLIRNSANGNPRPGMLSKGDLAQLRKFEPDGTGAPAVWRLLAEFFPDEKVEKLPQWACAFAAFAQLAENPSGKRLGDALGDAEFSEARFLRLLRASDEALYDAVRAASRFLVQKGTAVNPIDLALLVVGLPGEKAEKLRRSIAQSYYRALHHKSETANPSSKES